MKFPIADYQSLLSGEVFETDKDSSSTTKLLHFSLKEKCQKKRAGRAFAKKYEAKKFRENQAAPPHIPRGLVVFFAHPDSYRDPR